MTSTDPTRLTSDERGDLIDVVYGALLSNHLIGSVLIPAVERIVAARTAAARADAWQEGYEAAEYMAHCWGHTDHWWQEDRPPTNPYLKGEDDD